MRRIPTAGTRTLEGWGMNTLTRDDLDQIHAATLDVLQSTGIFVDHDEALSILEKGGCWVNKKTKVVRFPQHLVNEAMDQAPSHILLAGREPENDFMMGGRKVGFTPFGTGALTQDLETNEIRESTLEDVKNMAILCDALEHVDVGMPPVSAEDMPPSSYDLHGLAVTLPNTTKHVVTDAESGDRCEKMVEMGAAIAGGKDELRARPIVSFGVCPTSPLQLINECCDVIIASAKNWMPINVLSMALSGATAPIPLSGTLVVHNAEVISGIVLAQLTNPGTPVMYGSSTTTFNMKTVTATVGAPEMGMISAAVAELAHFYEVPCYVGGL
ncbi:MAG: trimethylamine methyltransferase family protein [Deltaproteobacteria bacterium]|nr:trimethylamine methyltransferase family protein [Deltaproteobacteria bacterium]